MRVSSIVEVSGAVCVAASSASTLTAQARIISLECAPIARDTIPGAVDAVFDACTVDEPTRLRSSARPSFPFREPHACAMAELEFVVDPTGRPRRGSERIVRANVDAFAEQVIRSLARWRFVPTRKRGAAVAQRVRVRYALMDEPGGRTPPPVTEGARRSVEPRIACPAS